MYVNIYTSLWNHVGKGVLGTTQGWRNDHSSNQGNDCAGERDMVVITGEHLRVRKTGKGDWEFIIISIINPYVCAFLYVH